MYIKQKYRTHTHTPGGKKQRRKNKTKNGKKRRRRRRRRRSRRRNINAQFICFAFFLLFTAVFTRTKIKHDSCVSLLPVYWCLTGHQMSSINLIFMAGILRRFRIFFLPFGQYLDRESWNWVQAHNLSCPD